MATFEVATTGDDYELPPRKKPKVTELPLSSVQRASIDGMLHTFKKKGEFDALRKKTFQQYNESAARGIFENTLRKFTTDEIEREPTKYLKPDRRLAAPLIEGAAARAQIYEKVDQDIDAYIEQYLVTAEKALRDIRSAEIGSSEAEAERQRGLKTDEAYAAEADERRKARAQKHVDEEKVRLKKESQERKKKELELLKQKQALLMRETEALQREAKRRIERDEWKRLEKERERERIREFNEKRDKAQKEAEEREKILIAEREKKEKERQEREQKRLEEEALDRLLREGKERERRARRPEPVRGDDMAPRSRLHAGTPRSAHSRDERAPASRRDDKVEERRRSRSPRYEDDRRNRRDNRAEEHHRSRSPRREDNRRRTSRERYREGTMRKESYYRELSAERELWKAKQERPAGEDGEVVESRKRSPSPRPSRREHTRSPARHTRQRSRAYSPPPRRRERSRSPISIDRYVPGQGSSRRTRDGSHDRRDHSRSRRSRSRNRSRDRLNDDRRGPRYEERPRGGDIDRYVPGRRERSRSRDRRFDRTKDLIRDQESEKRDREKIRK